MISRRIFAAVALLCALSLHAQAQQTKAALNAEINVQFPDNTSNAITPQNLRTVTSAIVNSIMPTAPVVLGNFVCFDGTTGLTKDCSITPGGSGSFTTLSASTYIYSNGGSIKYTDQNGAIKTANNQGPFMAESGGPQYTWHSTDSTNYETGTAQAGSSNTITLRAGASAINNFAAYLNATVTITGGTGAGQTNLITGYVGSTKVATISGSFSPSPDNTSTYSIGRCDYGWFRTVVDKNVQYMEDWESSSPTTCSDGPFGQQDEFLHFDRWLHLVSIQYPLFGSGVRTLEIGANYTPNAVNPAAGTYGAAQTPQILQFDSLSAATNAQIAALQVLPNNANPFVVIPSAAFFLQGLSSTIATGGTIDTGITSQRQLAGSGSAASSTMLRYTSPGGAGAIVEIGSSRGAAVGTFSAVQSGDGLGNFQFFGDNGTNYTGTSAGLGAVADGNFTHSSMPGRLVFSTTPSGATASSEALRIDSKQHVGFSGTIPTVGTCGTSPAVTTGSTDTAGEITTGSTATTSCLLTFANGGFQSAPFCAGTAEGATVTAVNLTPTLTTLTFNYASSTSIKIMYHCFRT